MCLFTNNMITPYWKPVGPTTHQIAKKFAKETDQKTAHTGSLDPMAKGVVVILTGEDRFRKDELSDGKKYYTVGVLAGTTTDTHDLLGMVTKTDPKGTSNLRGLIKALQSLTGIIHQKPPLYSARVVDGKPLFAHAREGSLTLEKVPEFEREIHSIDLLKQDTIAKSNLYYEVGNKIGKVKGDFRQEEILTRWQEVADELPDKLPLVKLEVVTSRGTYIRALVRDLSAQLDLPLVTYSLTRTQNGPYHKKDCQDLMIR